MYVVYGIAIASCILQHSMENSKELFAAIDLQFDAVLEYSIMSIHTNLYIFFKYNFNGSTSRQSLLNALNGNGS